MVFLHVFCKQIQNSNEDVAQCQWRPIAILVARAESTNPQLLSNNIPLDHHSLQLAAPIEAPLTMPASAPLPSNSYPQPPRYPGYIPPHSFNPPSPYGNPEQPQPYGYPQLPPYGYPQLPPYGYPKQPLADLFNDPMMMLLFSGGLGKWLMGCN